MRAPSVKLRLSPLPSPPCSTPFHLHISIFHWGLRVLLLSLRATRAGRLSFRRSTDQLQRQRPQESRDGIRPPRSFGSKRFLPLFIIRLRTRPLVSSNCVLDQRSCPLIPDLVDPAEECCTSRRAPPFSRPRRQWSVRPTQALSSRGKLIRRSGKGSLSSELATLTCVGVVTFASRQLDVIQPAFTFFCTFVHMRYPIQRSRNFPSELYVRTRSDVRT